MGPDASEMNSPLRNSPPFSNLLRVQAALFNEQQQFGCNLADKYFPHVHKLKTLNQIKKPFIASKFLFR